MPRTPRDANLGSRDARLRLKPRSKPYSKQILPGLFLRFRRRKNTSGSWIKREYLSNGSYHDERFATADDFVEADGETVLSYPQAIRATLASRPKPQAGMPTAGDALQYYFKFLADNEKATYADSKCRAEALIVPHLGDVPMGPHWPVEKERAWLAKLAKSPGRHTRQDDETSRRRKVTANRTRTILHAALNLMQRERHVQTDGAWRQVKPFRNVDTARFETLSEEQVRRLINAADPDFRRPVQGAVSTGLRWGELCALRVADFDSNSNTVRVRQSKAGKMRNVFLTDEGAALFRQWCVGRHGNEMLFTRGEQPWRAHDQTRPMLLACSRARIDPPVGFHALRHTYATLAVKAGMPLLVLAKNLGHRDTRMVELHYANLADRYIAGVVRDTAPRFGIEPDDSVVPLPVRP